MNRDFPRRARLLMPLFVGLVSVCTVAGSATPEEVAAFALKVATQLKSARYMEGTAKDDYTDIALVGWENLSTEKCRYTVKDTAGTIGSKQGVVVLLDPSAHTLSSWILNACEQVQPAEKRGDCAGRVLARLIDQSGGQFPVSGVVYEDLIPEDGVNEAYGFVSGVTVILPNIKHRGTARLSNEELEAALKAQPLKTASEHGPARVVGTTRCEYRSVHPEVDVDALKWLDVVGAAYKTAMKSDRNELIEIWLKFHPTGRKECDDARCPGDPLPSPHECSAPNGVPQ